MMSMHLYASVSVFEPAEPFSENMVWILCHLIPPQLHTSLFLAVSINGMADNSDLWVRKWCIITNFRKNKNMQFCSVPFPPPHLLRKYFGRVKIFFTLRLMAVTNGALERGNRIWYRQKWNMPISLRGFHIFCMSTVISMETVLSLCILYPVPQK